MPRARSFRVRKLEAEHREWAQRLLRKEWGGPLIVTRGRIHDTRSLPGFVALQDDRPVGLITYRLEGLECEIVSLNSRTAGVGVGSALLRAVTRVANGAGCSRLWLITTNDNMPALRFYQRRGFVLAALHRNALEESRRLKPQIAQVGLDGIPLRDEIELEILL